MGEAQKSHSNLERLPAVAGRDLPDNLVDAVDDRLRPAAGAVALLPQQRVLRLLHQPHRLVHVRLLHHRHVPQPRKRRREAEHAQQSPEENEFNEG